MAIRLFQEISDSIRRFIQTRLPGVAIRPMDQHSELFINPVSAELDKINLEVFDVRSKQNAANLVGTELDLYAANYGLRRLEASKAAGVVTVGTTALPRRNLTIPAGSRFLGGEGGSIAYVTLQNVILPSQSQFELNPQNSPYYIDPGLGVPVYAVRVPVEAVSPGLAANLDVNSVKIRGQGVPQDFNYITNEFPIEGGFNRQTDTEFLESINRFFLSNIPGNEEAIIRGVLEAAGNVFDIKVIGIGHPLMIRDNGLGGKIDVVIVGSKSVFVSQTFQNVTSLDPIPLKFYPISSVLSVVGTNLGLLPQSGYQLDQPEFPNPLAGTSKAKADLILTGTLPPNDTITITYTFNKSIYDASNYLSKKNISPGTDILVKLGTPQLVDCSVVVKLSQTASDTEVIRSRVQSAIQLFLNSFGLGQQVTVTQIVELIKLVDTQIVDIQLPFLRFGLNGADQQTEIFINDNEYIRAGLIEVLTQ